MKTLYIAPTSDTPKILLDSISGTFEISERCFPEDAMAFYSPIIEWLKNYSISPNSLTHFHFKFEYFNTSSSKQLFKIFLLLEELSKKNEVIISWYYSKTDSDMLLSGERYSKLLDLKFNMVEV